MASSPGVPDLNYSIDNDVFERYKFVRTRMREEVMYRRAQQWKVFSWVSSLYIAIIGGVIALTNYNHKLNSIHASSLVLVVTFLALFCFAWIRHEMKVAQAYSDEYHKLDENIKLAFDDISSKRWHLSYAGFSTIFGLLTIMIIAALSSA